MDPLTDLDWGTYYFFQFQARKLAVLQPVMLALNALANPRVTSVLILALVALLAFHRKIRPAIGVMLAFLAGIALIWNFREFMPSDRPPAAIDLAGPAGMRAAFPSASVLLFTLVAALWAMVPEFLGASQKSRFSALAAAVVLIILVILSQLFLKLYFLSDILAGLTAGLALALCCKVLVSTEPISGPEVRP